jgi:signal transduction histidine kinase
LEISVLDSGVGMSPEQMEGLFQPFTKIMENRNLNRDGVGLGLSVSQKIAKALGGKITVQSQLNFGSCFTLKLPLRKKNASLMFGPEEIKNESVDVL